MPSRERDSTDRIRVADMPKPLPCGCRKYVCRQQVVLWPRTDEIEKRLIWECLKRRRPELAAMLAQEAENIERIRAMFNGKVVVCIDGNKTNGGEKHNANTHAA